MPRVGASSVAFIQRGIFAATRQIEAASQSHIVEATKKFDLWVLPPILIIHLKRFEYTSHKNSKIDTIIEYPISQWKLTFQVGSLKPSSNSDPINNNNNKQRKYDTYDLYAMAHHQGYGIGSGHYTAHCKNRFDDE